MSSDSTGQVPPDWANFGARLSALETEARELERLVERAERLTSLGLAAAGIAHEVNNALVPVQNYAELLSTSASDDELRSRACARICSGIASANRIVQAILAFTRPGSPSISPAYCEVHAVVRNALLCLGQDTDGASKSTGVDVSHRLTAAADPDVLQHVLMNLLLNAGRACPDRSGITIRARQVAVGQECPCPATCSTWNVAGPWSERNPLTMPAVAIDVEDRGKGVDPITMSSLFQPLKADAKGAGIGLALCKHLVNKFNGTLAARSKPGTGTIFRLWLPSAELSASDRD